MDCTLCGGDNREGARFCRHCGATMAPLVEASLLADATVSMPAGGRQPEEAALPSALEPGELEPSEAPHGPPPDTGGRADTPQPMTAVSPQGPEVKAVESPLAGQPELLASLGPTGQDDGGTRPTPKPEGSHRQEQQPVPEHERELLPAPERHPYAPGTVAEELGAGHVPSLETGVAMAEAATKRGEDFAPGRGAEPPGDPAPAPVLEPGTVLADRYLVLEMLEADDERVLYRVRDLVRCWQCGDETNTAGEAYCAQCGASLDHKGDARLLEWRGIDAESAADPAGEAVVERFSHEGRSFLLFAGTRPEDEGGIEPACEDQAIRLLVGQRSDTGRVRELNEDSVLIFVAAPIRAGESGTSHMLGLLAVADGMGGHEGGEVASKLALQASADEILRSVIRPELIGETLTDEVVLTHMREAAVAANDVVYLERHKRENDMGTTLTLALIRDKQAYLAHVGDSRAYRWGADGLVQLTTDHSMVASLIASGRAEPEEVYTHPQRSVIYRSVGDRPKVEVDTAMLSMAPGDSLILCSDGLWEMIRDEGIADVMMLEVDPQAACDRMVHRANLAGGEDNISVVVVQVVGCSE